VSAGASTREDDRADAPFVSVIVPVLDDREALARCLAALAGQTYPPDRHEIVVVDNGSREDPSPALDAVPRARLVREATPGSYAARNRGIAEARGDVLAFTDSDCVPAPEWIERGAARLAAEPACGFVAGRVELTFHDSARPTAAELYDSLVMNFHQDRNVHERRFGATANLFTTRAVLAAVGPFDAALASGGDLEWGRRVFANGYQPVYEAGALVRHPARASLAAALARERRLTGGRVQLERRDGVSAFLALLRAWIPALGFYARLLADSRLPRLGDRMRVVGVALAIKYAGALERARLMLGAAPRRA
jgi:glycosyltransferase involved in cell wall biosynthesis